MDTTTTLADTLLDDLADLSDADESGAEIEESDVQEENENDAAIVTTELDESEQKQQAINKERALLENRFLDDKGLNQHLKRIRNLVRNHHLQHEESKKEEADLAGTGKGEQMDGGVLYGSSGVQKEEEEEVDYNLIVETNRYRNRLSDELSRVHGALCQVYGHKFPELEELLSSPIQYKTAVQVIQNEMDITRVNERLNQHFNSNQIITMSVASSTTEGRPLTADELEWALRLAAYMDEIDALQTELTRFVESRIRGLAPSVCALIGPQVAAQMVGMAGGLSELALIPACNLQVMGQIKTTAASRAGMSSSHHPAMATAQNQQQQQTQQQQQQTQHFARPQTQQLAREGILAQSDLFLSTNHAFLAPQHRTKLLKQVAAKVALCARCDAVNVQQGRPRTAAPGEKYRQEILAKLDQWQHPQDSGPVQKALPKPDLTVKKRRGGKRMRRLKERFEETALMKQANTRSFSSAAGEYGDDAMGLTLGLLDTEGGGMDGSVRKNTTGEKRPLRLANTKQARKQRALASRISQQHQQQLSGTSGLASTVAFTPLQAMELVNPDAQRERMVREANQKWFADNAGFQSAIPKKK
ncbi:hypothetical protein ACA910_001651 [Epithemia clementina (nom. ined.)]